MRYTLAMDPCHCPELPSYQDALNRLLSICVPVETQMMPLESALGSTVSADLVTDRDQPPFNRSAMDGFAVRSSDIKSGCTLTITGTVAAGASPICFQTPVQAGCAYRIATGAPVPVGADAVIPVELSYIDKGSTPAVRFDLVSVTPGKNIHRQGADAKAGDCVIAAGTVLGPHHIGIAAATGNSLLPVYRKLRVTLLTTGDEVRPAQTTLDQLQPQHIRNSNGPMIVALLSRLGVDDVTYLHIEDEPQPTLVAAQSALQNSDMVITIGGVSVGQRDHLPATWQKLGVEPVIHGVAIQPGKPVFAAEKQGKIIMGLPGNPVSVLATSHLFLWPVVCRLLNRPLPRWQNITLKSTVEAQESRERFRLVTCEGPNAQLLTWQGSGDLMHTACADGFVWLKRGQRVCENGETVPFLPLIQ